MQLVRHECRGGDNVRVGARKVRKSVGSGAHVDVGHGQHSRPAYANQGKMAVAEAEAMYVRALQGYEKA
jgi:hypothetical protein